VKFLAVIILSIGSEDWPFPVPIVQSKDRVQEVSAENQRIVGQGEAKTRKDSRDKGFPARLGVT